MTQIFLNNGLYGLHGFAFSMKAPCGQKNKESSRLLSVKSKLNLFKSLHISEKSVKSV